MNYEDEEVKVSPRMRALTDPPRIEKAPTGKVKWTDDVEKVIKEIGESCIGYKWMCILGAKQNETKYDVLMYFIICIGPLAGVFSSITISYPDENSWLQIISIVLSFVSGVISTSIKFAQLEEKSVSFKQVASKYASLEGNIRRQLNLARDQRVDAGEYLEWVSTSFDELFASTPLMPDSIYQSWVKFAIENNIAVPKELGGVITGSQIDQLCTIKIIDVNKENTDEDEKKETKRQTVYNNVSDLGRFGDGKMRYEMARLFGVRKMS